MTGRLTRREQQILAAVREGGSSKQIASQFGISPATVTWHLDNIYAKLDATNRAHAVAIALERGLLANKH